MKCFNCDGKKWVNLTRLLQTREGKVLKKTNVGLHKCLICKGTGIK